jgi:hypothetical protein
MNSTSKILIATFILLIKKFQNLVNFRHIPKFEILGCDNEPQLSGSGQESKK